MANQNVQGRSFTAGFALALAVMGVTRFAIEALRRVRAASAAAHDRSVIDGIDPPTAAARGAQPQEEASAADGRLVSEAVEMPATTQRW